jgi:hypothetical protein
MNPILPKREKLVFSSNYEFECYFSFKRILDFCVKKNNLRLTLSFHLIIIFLFNWVRKSVYHSLIVAKNNIFTK